MLDKVGVWPRPGIDFCERGKSTAASYAFIVPFPSIHFLFFFWLDIDFCERGKSTASSHAIIVSCCSSTLAISD